MKRLHKIMVTMGILFITLFTMVIPVSAAQTLTFDDLYMTLEVPEDYIVITPDTPKSDMRWKEAGITEVDTKLKEFSDMGVRAMFYHKKANTSVILMVKNSSTTRETVNLIQMNESELTEYFDGLIDKDSESYDSSVKKYEHQQTPFFNIRIQSKEGQSPVCEVMYGTVMNGRSISFDIYKEGRYIQEEEEQLARDLVDQVNFTKILDASELAEQTQIKFQDFLAPLFFLCVIVVLIIIYNRKNKKAAEVKKRIAKDMQDYRLNRKKLEEAGELVKEEVIYTNTTEYHEQAMKTYCLYNHFFKRIGFWCYVVVLYAFIMVYCLFFNTSVWVTILAAIAGVAYAYYQGIAIEKMVEAMKKRYADSRTKNAILKFYDDYFTVSGIQYISDFPYVQVTEVRKYKNYIYFYLGTELAYFVDVTTFTDEERKGFTELMKQRMGTKYKVK